MTMNIGKDFAVTRHETGLALYCAPSGRLVRMVSADGLHWHAEHFPEAPHLIPLSAVDEPRGEELLCKTPEGKVRIVRLRGDETTVTVELPEVALPERWYDQEGPDGLAAVREEHSSNYWVLFGAKRRQGRETTRRGCVGMGELRDSGELKIEPPIFAPNRHFRISAPRVFNHEGRIALIYAADSEEGTRSLNSAVGPNVEGPFERIEPDVLAVDARVDAAFPKHGQRRLVFFNRRGEGDGFSISRPGQFEFRGDGRPCVKFHGGLLKMLGKPIFHTEALIGSAETLARVLPRHGSDFRLEARVKSQGALAAGVLFRTNITGHDNVALSLDFDRGALIMRRGINGRLLGRMPHKLTVGEEYRLSVWAEGHFADVYLDDEWLLTAPTSGRQSGGFGFFVTGGEARFASIEAQSISGL